MRPTALTILFLAACNGPAPDESNPDPTDPVTDSGTDTGTPITEPPDERVEVSAATADLNEVVGTVVIVGWDQSADALVHLEYSFDEGVWLSTPERSLGAGHHEELLLGIPYDTVVTWRIVAIDDLGPVSTPDAVIHTALIPEPSLVPALLSVDPAGYDPTLPWLLTSIETYSYGVYTVIVDRQGRPVWVLQAPTDRWTGYGQLSPAGDSLLIDHNSLFAIFDGGVLGEVAELKIDGSVVRTWATPGLHQPFVGLPDGSIAYARQYTADYLEDVTVVAADGTVSQVFDCDAWLAVVAPSRFCSSNTLKRDPVTGHFWLTVFTVQTTIEIDPTSGAALRWFGNAPGSWTVEPPEAALVYPHGGYLTAAGTLLTSDSVEEAASEMLVREYSLDPSTETLTEIWSFGLGEGVIGYGFGDVFRLPNGNTQQNCGVARLKEITPAGEVVWDLEWQHPFYPFMMMGLSTSFADLYALAPDRP